jgi:hypothetical protein
MSNNDDVTVDSSTTDNAEAVAEPTQVAEATAEATEEPKTIPYDRFKEVNDKLGDTSATVEELNRKIRDLETRTAPQAPAQDPNLEAAKEQIRALGFITKDEQEQQLKQQNADAQLERELTRLENSFNGEDGSPKFTRKDVIAFAIEQGIPNPEIAFKAMKEKEILDWQIKQALTKSKGIKTESSDGSGSSQTGTTDADLKEAIRGGDKNALRTYLKRLTKTN